MIDLASFDIVYNRRDTNSFKWDSIPPNTLAMWLADMDFQCPKEILDGLHSIIEHGILGYFKIDDSYYKAVTNWFNTYHGMNLQENNIIPVSGILLALRAIIHEFSGPEDYVIIQPPVYPQFSKIIETSNRKILTNPLVIDENNNYQIDMSQLHSLSEKAAKIFVLCSPHNPIGRLWEKTELESIAQFCIDHNILLVVDEIHCDLILPNYQFISAALLDKRLRDNMIILNSATKTFNVAGLGGGNAIVFHEKLKIRLKACFQARNVTEPNPMFVRAATIGYSRCREWVTILMQYIKKNYDYIVRFVEQELPAWKVFPLQATYLVWLNYQNLNISEKTFLKMIEKYMTVSPGATFGQNGEGFIRLNIACPHKTLKQAMLILKNQSS